MQDASSAAAAAAVPEDPPHEIITPVIHHAVDKPQIWVVPLGRRQPVLRQVFVSRSSSMAQPHPAVSCSTMRDNDEYYYNRNSSSNTENTEEVVIDDTVTAAAAATAAEATIAYQIFPPEAFQPIELSHGGPVWGHVYKGFIIERGTTGGTPRGDNTITTTTTTSTSSLHFREPAEDEAKIVAIKRLDRRVVDQELKNGSRENPYREIYRMQTIGDNHHVLGIIEALQNDDYLYICTPWANVGSLSYIGHDVTVPKSRPVPKSMGRIPRELPLEEERARRIFRQMLEALEYLHERCGVCHRDIKPANFLVNNQGRVLLADLAMTFRMPPSGIVNHIGHFGTPPYWVPEILAQLPFDGRGCDLWACMISLFNLVSGLPVLYRFPHHSDRMFCFSIMAGGLSRNMHNPLVQQVAQEASANELVHINETALRTTNLTEELLEMFENTLRLDPNMRWTRQDVLQCEWMNAPP